MTLSTVSHVPLNWVDLISPDTTALVMWDMQRGLAGRAANVDQIVKNASLLLGAADRAGMLVVWSRHIFPPFHLTVGPFLLYMMKKQGVTRPDQLKPWMQAGMEETEYLPGFCPAAHHVILEKSAPSLFIDTPLDLRLKARGTKTIVMAGATTDIGISFTARHALALGYFSVVAEDATGAYSSETHSSTISYLRTWTQVACAEEICRAWKN